jgi:hypothetical protein
MLLVLMMVCSVSASQLYFVDLDVVRSAMNHLEHQPKTNG